jgi:hypothetical protein
MNELENKIEADLTPAKKTKKVELTPLEASIQARKHDLTFPALQAMFELNEVELQAILDKLPSTEDCNC